MGTMTPDHCAWLTGMVEHCAARAAALEDDPHPSAPMRAAVLHSIAQRYRAEILGLALPVRPSPPLEAARPLSTILGEQLPLFELTA